MKQLITLSQSTGVMAMAVLLTVSVNATGQPGDQNEPSFYYRLSLHADDAVHILKKQDIRL